MSDWGDDDARVAEVLRAAMDDAEIDTVDAIFASANGSRRGDAVEARAIARVFGDNVPPVVATKGEHGEYAAAGAMQLAAALAALRDQQLPAFAEYRARPVRWG